MELRRTVRRGPKFERPCPRVESISSEIYLGTAIDISTRRRRTRKPKTRTALSHRTAFFSKSPDRIRTDRHWTEFRRQQTRTGVSGKTGQGQDTDSADF